MAALAQAKRKRHGVQTRGFGLREMRRIYSAEQISIDYWPYRLRKLRAAYVNVDGVAAVLLNKGIKPVEPRLFSLAHELKHHYVDADSARAGLGCKENYSYEEGSLIEVGAEVFAAEFIFPEAEFIDWLEEHLESRPCSAEDVVRLKNDCPAIVSHTFLAKRLERLGYAAPGSLQGIPWNKLRDNVLGIPWYRQRRKRPNA